MYEYCDDDAVMLCFSWPASRVQRYTCVRYSLHTFCICSSRLCNWKAYQWLSGAQVWTWWSCYTFTVFCKSMGSRVSNICHSRAFFTTWTYWKKMNTVYRLYLHLTLSSLLVWNGYTLKCSGSYWSNPPFLFIQSAFRVPECQKLERVG